MSCARCVASRRIERRAIADDVAAVVERDRIRLRRDEAPRERALKSLPLVSLMPLRRRRDVRALLLERDHRDDRDRVDRVGRRARRRQRSGASCPCGRERDAHRGRRIDRGAVVRAAGTARRCRERRLVDLRGERDLHRGLVRAEAVELVESPRASPSPRRLACLRAEVQTLPVVGIANEIVREREKARARRLRCRIELDRSDPRSRRRRLDVGTAARRETSKQANNFFIAGSIRGSPTHSQASGCHASDRSCNEAFAESHDSEP